MLLGTGRIDKPDTQADILLKECLTVTERTSFIMTAGAGSGKTTSLVKALRFIEKSYGKQLINRGQRIACITYTEVATEEIWKDVDENSIFHVSTIHSFLWELAKSFQSDIKVWVGKRLDEKIEDNSRDLEKPRIQKRTRERLIADTDKLLLLRVSVMRVDAFSYGVGSDYEHGVLGHEDILSLVPWLIMSKPLMRTIIAQRFPFIFVDESQDTAPKVVEALREVSKQANGGFCLGFFGDPMQQIYSTGVGEVKAEENWRVIKKEENFRCSLPVLSIINNIRAEADGLSQRPGVVGFANGRVGAADLFVLPADENRESWMLKVRHWMSRAYDDKLWVSDTSDADLRVLVLVHRMAAKRLGFEQLYAALNDKAPSSIKNGFIDGTSWVVRPFLQFILPLVWANKSSNQFEVISILREYSPAIEKKRLNRGNTASTLKRVSADVRMLTELVESKATKVYDVLKHVFSSELFVMDARFLRHMEMAAHHFSFTPSATSDLDELAEEEKTILAFFSCPAHQLIGYRTYIEDESPFATQQGIKGAEFNRVLTVLDDEEGSYNLFSYEKYLNLKSLSDTDVKNRQEGKESVIDRTRRLFYVCCSRAKKDLAVVLFVSDVERAVPLLRDRGLFPVASIHTPSDFDLAE